MPLMINNIKAALSESEQSIVRKGLKLLCAQKASVKEAAVHKISLDARRRENIHYVCSVYAELDSEESEKRLSERNKK